MATLSDKTVQQARVCFLFGAVFIFIGMGVIALGAYEIVDREPPDPGAFLTTVFGGMFGLAGLALVRAGRRIARKAEADRARREANRDKPWAQREDWARGVVRCSSRNEMFLAWGFTLFWNLVSSPLPFAIWKEVTEKENKLALIGLLFPIVGVCAGFWAIRATLRYWKFGVTELHLRAVPARPGGYLAGVIHVKTRMEPSDGYHVQLTCIHRTVTGSGRNQTTRNRIVWQEEHVVDRELQGGDFMSTRAPISVALPADAKETTTDDPRDRILWLLEVSADVFGVDYKASFEVPVFHADSVRPLAEDYVEGEDWAERYRRSEERGPAGHWAPESESGVQIERLAHGAKEFYFPPARNVGAAISITLFTTLWSGVIWLLVEQEAPIVFPIAFGLFDVLLILACLSLWFGSTRTRLDGEGITVTSRVFGVGSSKVISARDVEALDLSIGMQSGKTPYYDIVARCRGGRKVSLGSAVRDKREAERLVDEMKGCLPETEPREAAPVT